MSGFCCCCVFCVAVIVTKPRPVAGGWVVMDAQCLAYMYAYRLGGRILVSMIAYGRSVCVRVYKVFTLSIWKY